jgi:dihydroorotate dehydrogenase electron transfer subunit
MVLNAPELAQTAIPGQFVHVLCGSSHDPLLRRPFSIFNADGGAGQIAIMYEIRGRGTALLAEKRVGESVDVIGPLGNGFTLPECGNPPVVLVGGGIGAAPLYYLARMACDRVGDECVSLHMGARTAGLHVCHDEFSCMCQDDADSRYWITTDDGSMGEHGFVTDLLLRRIEQLGPDSAPTIYACGPMPMLKAVAGIAKDHGIKCQVSLESKMACGVGACMGCVVKVRDGDGFKYVRVCNEGPVFDAEDIVWE